MMILCANLVCVAIIALIDTRYIISFEVAFVGALLIVYSSYKSIMRKIENANSTCSDFLGSASSRSLQRTASPSHSLNSHNPKNSSTILEFASNTDSAKSVEFGVDSHIDSASSKSDTQETPENLSKKERFFLGAKISFGLLRLLSYAFLGLGIVVLINNGAFFLLPFLAGIALSTLISAIYAMRRKV